MKFLLPAHYSQIRLLLIFLVIFTTILLVFAKAQESFAQSPNQGLEISPAFKDITIENSSEVKTIDLTLTNHTNAPLTLEMFPIDFKTQDEFGNLSFLGANSGSYSYSLSSFLSLESNRLDLSPKQKKVFRVQITNRDDLSPGGHYAAIVAKMVTAQGDNKSLSTAVAPSVSSLILLRKSGGERFNLSLVDVDYPQLVSMSNPKTLNLKFQNEGNIHLVPYGTIEIKDLFNRTLFKGPINTSSLKVFPESRRKIAVELVKSSFVLPISFNTITIQGRDSLKKTNFLYRESYIYIHPLLALLIILSFLLIILWRISYTRRFLKAQITRLKIGPFKGKEDKNSMKVSQVSTISEGSASAKKEIKRRKGKKRKKINKR